MTLFLHNWRICLSLPYRKLSFMNIIRDLQFPTTFTLKNENWKLKFSRISAKLWKEKPTKLRTLPKLIFKSKIRMFLYTKIWRLLWRLRIDNIKRYKILLVVITFVSSILSYSFCLIYPPLTTLYCVSNLNGSKSVRSKPKVSLIEHKSQCDRRVNDYKNYSFASV
mgnify:CR=1 FL=1